MQPLLTGGARRRAGAGIGLARTVWPLALYAGLSIVLFGLPVIGHLGSHIVAADQIDSSAVMWLLAWWPHALLHGLNPFVTHQAFYPEGYNLEWSTSMPLEGILLAPVTLAFSPAVTWNIIQLASPALSAWTAYLLCRHLTGRTWPSLIGGYMFGFSSYVMFELIGAPSLALVALLPVFALLVLKLLERSISRRSFVIAMGVSLAAQYLSSQELLATSTMFGAFALLAAYLLIARLRSQITAALEPLALSYLLALVLISPWLYFFLFGHHYPPVANKYHADLASFVLPPKLVALQLHSGPPYIGSNGQGYLGLPLIVLVLELVWQRRHSRGVLLGALCALVAAIASLGGTLLVRGHQTSIWLPWNLLAHLPVLRYAIPARFGVFVILPLSLLVAVSLSGHEPEIGAGRRALRWMLAVAALLTIFPAVGSSDWNTAISDPPFFAQGTYSRYLTRDDHVLTIPAWGPNERWVADAGFPFAITAGYLGNPLPVSYTRYPIWNTFLSGRLTPGYAAQLRRFIAAKDVTAIVVADHTPGPWQTLFATLHVEPVAVGGVLVYRLRGQK
ncbi:MAG: hypothetical protein ACLPV4_05135 [Solirubrobacteraceae bacterium]